MIKNFIEIPITELVKADWNYKKDDEDKREKLKNNIKRNGQIENIIVRRLDSGFYEVVNGNHRFDALKDLNVETAICYDLGKISQQQAIRIAIETNETKFESDHLLLAERIQEIIEEFSIDDLIDTMPYSEQELNNYSELLDFDWSQFEKDDINIDLQNGKFIITIEANSIDQANMFLQEKGLDYCIKEGQNKINIKL